jgi:hypothetical protein
MSDGLTMTPRLGELILGKEAFEAQEEAARTTGGGLGPMVLGTTPQLGDATLDPPSDDLASQKAAGAALLAAGMNRPKRSHKKKADPASGVTAPFDAPPTTDDTPDDAADDDGESQDEDDDEDDDSPDLD